jgi:hypothetical protein
MEPTLNYPEDKLKEFERVYNEANLLRFPIFYLGTKRLHDIDQIECSGELGGAESGHFRIRAYRSVGFKYPGPQSREAHLAFTSMIHELTRSEGAIKPFVNPLGFTWKELCRRMGIGYSGRAVEQLKMAIMSTKGLLIVSENALYDKTASRRRTTNEAGVNLYDKVVFQRQEMEDGSEADRNFVWFSDWYLRSINAMFNAPLNYRLWWQMNQRSTIASRLYEMLLLRFHRKVRSVRYEYSQLANLLPVTTMFTVSKAQEQLDTALNVLVRAEVIRDAVWTRKPDLKPTQPGYIELVRGKLFGDAEGTLVDTDDGQPITSSVHTADDRADGRTADEDVPFALVGEFYRLWTGSEPVADPTPRELEQARKLIEEHGEDKAPLVVRRAVAAMRKQWPEARTFGAVLRYVPDAIRDAAAHEKNAASLSAQTAEAAEEARRRGEAARQGEEFKSKWRPVYQRLTDDERRELDGHVADRFPFLKGNRSMIELMTLKVLSQRQTAAV